MNIAVVSFVINDSFITPLKNLENGILGSNKNSALFFVGHSCVNRIPVENLQEFTGIKNNIGIINYILISVDISLALLKLRNKYELCILFMEFDALLPIIILKIINKKIVRMLPSRICLFYHENLLNKLQCSLQDISYKISDKIIVYSTKLLDEWKINPCNNNKIIIHSEHIIDTNKFYIINDIDIRDNYIGYVGRLSNEKGIISLIMAIKKMVDDGEDIKLLIIGTGPLENEINGIIIDNKLHNNIEMVGWIKHDLLINYYNNIRLLLIPSCTEGLPNVALESMACGTPVLATRVGLLPEIIDNNKTGYFVDNGDPIELAKTIKTVLSDKNCKSVSINASNFIKKKYSKEMVVRKWDRILSYINGLSETYE